MSTNERQVIRVSSVWGFASTVAGSISQWQFDDDRAVSNTEVLVEVTHCALGRGDVEYVDRRFNSDAFVVPGHEIVGVVVATGQDVSSLTVGDRVGVGYQVTCCGECASCRGGLEQYCREQQCLIENRPGGLAVRIRVDERFAVQVPEGLDSATAAALMSAGLTAYSAVKAAGIKDGMQVAIVGLGGMGHVASQLVHRAGGDVTAVTSKQLTSDEMLRLGVDSVFPSRDLGGGLPSDRFDRIFVTTGALHELDPLLNSLTPTGVLVLLGSPITAMTFSVFKLNDFSARRVQGGYVGSMRELRELLDLAASGDVGVLRTVLPFTDAAGALQRIRSNEGGYRIVLERDLTTQA